MLAAVNFSTLAICIGIGLAFGQRYERTVAILMAFAVMATVASQHAAHQYAPAVVHVFIDIIVLMGFLYVYSQRNWMWVRVIAASQLFMVMFIVYYLFTGAVSARVYLSVLAGISYIHCAALCFGVARQHFGSRA